MKAIIEEQGNGFPNAGDYVSDSDQLYRVESIDSRIQTEQFRNNYVYATVEPVEWGECSEADQHTARVELCRTADQWWAWHDQRSSRWSEDHAEAAARCTAWVAGESDDGPES